MKSVGSAGQERPPAFLGLQRPDVSSGASRGSSRECFTCRRKALPWFSRLPLLLFGLLTWVGRRMAELGLTVTARRVPRPVPLDSTCDSLAKSHPTLSGTLGVVIRSGEADLRRAEETRILGEGIPCHLAVLCKAGMLGGQPSGLLAPGSALLAFSPLRSH